MKCTELLTILSEYVDDSVDAGLRAELEKHVASCEPCQVVIDNIRKTITLYRSGQAYELPSGVHDRLANRLRDHWNRTHQPGHERRP
jgi:anti-sigma factor RsiW